MENHITKKKRSGKSKVPKRVILPLTLNQGDPAGDLTHLPSGWESDKLQNQIYRVKQTVDKSTIVSSNAGAVLGAFNFQLSDTDNNANFTALYDQYRIVAVSARFRPMYTAQPLQNTAAVTSPVLYTVLDYDDSNAPASIAALREYQSCKETRYDENHIRNLKPRIAMAAYAGAFTSFANVSSQWIDAASPSVQHYAIKYGVPATTGAQAVEQVWTVECDYFLEFRQVR